MKHVHTRGRPSKPKRPKEPLDKNGVKLVPGDDIASCAERYDTDHIHYGSVMRIEEVSLVVVRHEDGCCDRGGKETRSAAFLWEKIK